MAIAAAAPSRAITAADISDQMVERVIGKTRDFLAILFFDKGTVSSRLSFCPHWVPAFAGTNGYCRNERAGLHCPGFRRAVIVI